MTKFINQEPARHDGGARDWPNSGTSDETLAQANPRRFAISSSSGSVYRLYWHEHSWAADTPDRLYTAEEADAEVRRLRGALPHDKTIQRVDTEQLAAMGIAWNAVFNPTLAKSGYGEIPLNERQSESAKALRAAAVELADQAVREAGFSDFKGWQEWTHRLAEVPVTAKNHTKCRVARTSDGYSFTEALDGSWSDGDMTFNDIAQLLEQDPDLLIDGLPVLEIDKKAGDDTQPNPEQPRG